MTALRWPFGLIGILSALLLAAGCATTPAANATPSAVPGAPGPILIHALVDVTADPTVVAFAEKTRFVAPIMGTVGSASAGSRVGDDLRVALNRTPDVQALGCYDAAWIAASVADQGTGRTAPAVKESFVETADRFTGASGECALTSEGDRLIPIYDFWVVGSLDGIPRWEKAGWSAEWTSGTFRFIPLDRTSPKP